jgi:hypothetical protein
MSISQLSQSFGNHLILGISGTSLNDDDKRALNELKPIGVIFFAKNFLDGVKYPVWLEQFKNLIDEVRQYTERDSIFTTLDHEGGRVVRTPLPITRFPQAYLLQSHAYEVAKATALELKSLGINLSWSPVADIFSNPQNPIIGARAFGITPETTSEAVGEYYRGLREEGILGSDFTFSTKSELTHTVDYLPKNQARKLYTFSKNQLDLIQNPIVVENPQTPVIEEVVESVEVEEITNYAELMPTQEVISTPEPVVISDNIYANMTKDQLFEKLQNHKKLLDNGLILQGEYDALKKEILPFL